MRALLRAAVVVVVLMGAAAPARAGGGLLSNQDIKDAIFYKYVYQQAGIAWTFRTQGLVPSTADTVIHVQLADDPRHPFVAGDDDSGGGTTSLVNVPVAPTGRMLLLIVRSYSSSTTGVGELTEDSSLGDHFSTFIAFGGSRYQIGNSSGNLASGSHVRTTEPPDGAPDTVLIVSQGNSHGVSFDDDAGVGNTSWAHTAETCLSPCWAVVGTYDSSGTFKTNIIWDEDLDTHDADGDGVGDGLEQSLQMQWASDPTLKNRDSDLDGIMDGAELYGYEPPSGGDPVRFPRMGALPTFKDLFIEVDWLKCTAGCDPVLGQDTNKMQGTDVMKYVADFQPLRVHMDIGTANSDPNTNTYWNDWGGAHRLDTAASPCDDYTPSRVNMFHHQITGNGGQAAPGQCLWGERSDRVGAHELGHNLFLAHGGRPPAIAVNHKPNYLSMMNYGYEYTPGEVPAFSHGTSPVMSINPVAAVERMSPKFSVPILTLLRDGDWKYKVDIANGWVDWNRDGEFAPAGTTVRAGVACMTSWNDFCTLYAGTELPSATGLGDLTLVWQKGVGGSIGDRLLLLGVNASKNVVYKSALKSTMDASCKKFTSYDGDFSNCAGLNKTANSAGPSGTTNFAPAAASIGTAAVMVVVADSTNKLKSYILTTTTGGTDSWSPGTTLPGNVVIQGDPAMVATGPTLTGATVWAPAGGRLKKWVYTPGAGWANPVDEVWTDQSFIAPANTGIAVTRGYESGTSTPNLYAVIPMAGTSPYSSEFARLDSATGRWFKFANAWDGTGHAYTISRPGLAYVPTGGAEPVSNGRFYVGWATASSGVSLLMMTEGNKPPGTSTTKRLAWVPPTLLRSGLKGGVAMAYDTNLDSNLRVAYTYPDGTSYFDPNADAIIDAPLKDMDDYQYLQGALRAAFGIEPLPLP